MITKQLTDAIAQGIRQIGQIVILPDTQGAAYALCHIDDCETLDGLEVHHDPAVARDISTWAADGHYRFTKGELSLKKGWLLLLEDAESLRRAIDLFYPASLGLWLADQSGELEVENLRDKLNRQTGMYKFAGNISDEGAQKLVQTVCGPANCCVKDIRWQLDADTPLDDSEASRFNGKLDTGKAAIPLLCREACNHFVAECRKVSKKEFESQQTE
jgi:sirohydrochlorin cobaltochelatase